MRPPIIAYESGDVLAFQTVEQAERYLEPIDVSNGEYVIYDAEGRLIEARVGTPWAQVRLVDTEGGLGHQEELRSILGRFLTSVTSGEIDPAGLSLSDLVALTVSRYPTI